MSNEKLITEFIEQFTNYSKVLFIFDKDDNSELLRSVNALRINYLDFC